MITRGGLMDRSWVIKDRQDARQESFSRGICHGASSHSTSRCTHWTRVCGRKKNSEEAKAQALDMQATQPPTSELGMALKALPRAEDPPPPPQTVNELMEGTLKDYEEERVEEGTVPSQLTTEVGDPEDQDLDQMETQLNNLLYEKWPFHPRQFIHCVNLQTEFDQLRYKCPQQGCPVYLFEDTREVMFEKLKEDTHPQVRALLQRGLLKCQCGFTSKMKLGRTTKNYNKVFLSCGSFLPGQEPCGYFQWLHGPLWRPREQAQPYLRRQDTPHGRGPYDKDPAPLLKKHCLDTGKDDDIDGPLPQEWLYGKAPSWVSESQLAEARRKESNRQWLKQFAESAAA